jgi:hypothetical protein
MNRLVLGVVAGIAAAALAVPAAQSPRAVAPTVARKPPTYAWPWALPSNPPRVDGGYTLAWDVNHLDLNGLALNADWAPRTDALPVIVPTCLHPSSQSGSTCDGVPGADRANDWKLSVCRVAGSPFPGHVNWAPATVTGYVSWGNLADDGDDNLFFEPTSGAGLTHANHLIDDDPRRPYIELEFASYETISRMSTSHWSKLRDAIDRWASEPIDSSEIDAVLNASHPGLPSRAVVTGLFGLDCEHGCPSEIHPVYGLAIEANDSPDDNTWILFARNWGNEGFCSRTTHLADTDHLTIALPGLSAGEPTITSVEVATANPNTEAPTVSVQNDHSVVVDFTLPAPSDAELVEFVMHLKWSKARNATRALAESRPRPRPAVTRVQRNKAVADLEHISAGLGRDAQIVDSAKRSRAPSSRDAIARTSPRSATIQMLRREFVRASPTLRPLVGGAPRTLARLQDQAEENDRKMIQAACAAGGGRLPGLSVVDSARVCQQVGR